MTIPSIAPKNQSALGLTLIEVTVLILALLTLVGMLFSGVAAWKKSADRTACIMNISQTQKAVRFLASVNGLSPGMNAAALPRPIDLEGQLLGESGYFESEPVCPGKGVYTFGGDQVPEPGELYLSCSLGLSGRHVPMDHGGW